MLPYLVLPKAVGQTPLEVLEAYKAAHPKYTNVPMAYAGRLDPMASGLLLILVGETCKRQADFHNLDKTYEFSVLFGVHSDTADVLGIVSGTPSPAIKKKTLDSICRQLIGPIELPYPHYSSKTVRGKPLHTWALEGRLDEISIPKKQSTIYRLSCIGIEQISATTVYEIAQININRIPPITDARKALGADFRRDDVRASWAAWLTANQATTCTVAHFTCTASSGTYMRTLAEVIARQVGTVGLAWRIHRTTIGRYRPLPFGLGYWQKRYVPDRD